MKNFGIIFWIMIVIAGCLSVTTTLMIDSRMDEMETNIDEINIMHATKRLLNHPSNTKMLVVLSDGMTRGSLSELQKSINFATKNGVDVIGIGIGNRGSWREYINNVQIEKPEQLIHSIVNITKDILIKNIKLTSGVA